MSKRKLDDFGDSAFDDEFEYIDEYEEHGIVLSDLVSARMPRSEPNAAHSLLNGQLDSRASDASSAFYANSTRSASVLQFFVKLMPESYNLVIKACANDTVQSLHEKIQSFTGIPVIEQRLMYRGKQLQWEQSLAECSIENNAGLQLLARLRSTKLPQHWQVIGDLLSTVCRLCKGELHPSAFKVIRTLMSDYFKKISTVDIDLANSQLNVFMSSSASAALVMLYM